MGGDAEIYRNYRIAVVKNGMYLATVWDPAEAEVTTLAAHSRAEVLQSAREIIDARLSIEPN